MKFKSILCFVLSIILCLGFSMSAFASNLDVSNSSNINVARLDNATDLHSTVSQEDVITNFDITFSLTSDGLQIQGNIENISFAVSGHIATRNYNGKILFYNGNDTTENYKILYLSVEQDVNNHLLFDDIVENKDNYLNVIKLYMQPTGTDNFIIIEIFIENDFVSNLLSSNVVSYDETQASVLHSWFINYIDSVNGTEVVGTRASNTVTYKRSYDFGGFSVTYYLGVQFVADVTNLKPNGSGSADCYVEVVQSNSIDNSTGDEWDRTQTYLTFENVNVSFLSIPNTVITAQTPIRKGNVDTTARVSFSIREDTFTASSSVIMTYSGLYMRDSRIDFSSRITSTSGVRTTETGYLPDRYSMREVGDCYGFNVEYKDMIGEEKTAKAPVRFQFDLTFGLDTTQGFSDYKSLNASISISN